MDKGIFYLVCSVFIIAVVAYSTFFVVHSVQNQCVGKTVVEKVEVTEAPTPTATPSAKFGPVFKSVSPTSAVK